VAEAEAKWYVVHTYSGYENKVKVDLEKTIANNKDLAEKIIGVEVPTESVMEVKDGKKKVVDRKMCPGYVIVHMVLDDRTWYIVRNTRGVTGFVGPGSKPAPLDETEKDSLEQERVVKADFAVDDTIMVIDGPWKDTVGKVTKIDENKQTATIMVEMFGMETPVEISFSQVKKLD
jgi:transcriptional antiterminator NusG